jgi:hypothetical protein
MNPPLSSSLSFVDLLLGVYSLRLTEEEQGSGALFTKR